MANVGAIGIPRKVISMTGTSGATTVRLLCMLASRPAGPAPLMGVENVNPTLPCPNLMTITTRAVTVAVVTRQTLKFRTLVTLSEKTSVKSP